MLLRAHRVHVILPRDPDDAGVRHRPSERLGIAGHGVSISDDE